MGITPVVPYAVELQTMDDVVQEHAMDIGCKVDGKRGNRVVPFTGVSCKREFVEKGVKLFGYLSVVPSNGQEQTMPDLTPDQAYFLSYDRRVKRQVFRIFCDAIYSIMMVKGITFEALSHDTDITSGRLEDMYVPSLTQLYWHGGSHSPRDGLFGQGPPLQLQQRLGLPDLLGPCCCSPREGEKGTG